MIETTTNQDYFEKVFLEALRPDPTILLDQWADESFQVPELGRFDITNAPYVRRILQLLSWADPAQEIYVIKGVQLIFTTVLDILNQSTIHRWPKRVLNIFGADGMSQEWVKLRLETAIEENPCLIGRVRESRERGGSSTQKLKIFPNGSIKSVGGVSGKNFRAYDASVVCIDDADSLKLDIGGTKDNFGEGHPFKLAKDRTNGKLGRFKFYVQGSPTAESTSLMLPAFRDTDQAYYNFPCPRCNAMQVIDFNQIIYENCDEYKLQSEPYLKCIKCEEKIFENKKHAMLNDGDWISTAVSSHDRKFGFCISSAYSLIGYTWTNMVNDWLDACRDAARGKMAQKITFYNTKRAEPWVDQRGTAKVNPKGLYPLREPWLDPIHENCVILTMGVDIQKNRIEATITGTDSTEQRYFVEHVVIWGETIIKYGNPASPFNDLEELIAKKYNNSHGFEQPILCTAIDTGFRGTIVGGFIKKMRSKGYEVHGIFGDSTGSKKKMFIGSEIKNEYGYTIREINVNEGKDTMFRQLQMKLSGDGKQEIMLHWSSSPSFTEEHFRQFCSEYPVEKVSGDNIKVVWEKSYTRNEPWDTANYQAAAQAIYGIGGIDWESFRKWNKNGCRLNNSNQNDHEIISEGLT